MLFKKEIHFDIIASTNTYIKENYKKLENGTIVTARHQTHGKGRMNRTWIDGDDLLISFLIKEDLLVNYISKLGLVSAAATFQTIKKYLDNVKVKWPNDILINDKKISGILLESVISNDKLECLIIGIGINVNTYDFPKGLLMIPTSLGLELNKSIDVNKIKKELLINFDKNFQEYKEGKNNYLKICKENSCLINRDVIFNDFNVEQMGKVIDILDNGNILIKVNNELKEFNYGEISLTNYYSKEI